jgi:hypothetical protein
MKPSVSEFNHNLSRSLNAAGFWLTRAEVVRTSEEARTWRVTVRHPTDGTYTVDVNHSNEYDFTSMQMVVQIMSAVERECQPSLPVVLETLELAKKPTRLKYITATDQSRLLLYVKLKECGVQPAEPVFDTVEAKEIFDRRK